MLVMKESINDLSHFTEHKSSMGGSCDKNVGYIRRDIAFRGMLSLNKVRFVLGQGDRAERLIELILSTFTKINNAPTLTKNDI